MKSIKRYLSILLVLIMSLSLISCSSKTETTKFNSYLDKVFKEQVEADSMGIHYTLAHPEKLGLEHVVPALPTISQDEFNKSIDSLEKDLKELDSFNYNKLTDNEKLTYDILKHYYNTELTSKDYYLYSEILSPTLGVQAQLPIFFAEYRFDKQKDVDDYLRLLSETLDFYKNIITFEKEKATNGLFMADFAVDDVIKQCEGFIAHREDNYLIDVFNNKLDTLEGLTQEQKTTYINKNKELVLNTLIPAYEHIITELTALKGNGKNQGGLANFSKGKEYYEYLVKSYTGSDKSVKEIADAIDNKIRQTYVAAIQIISVDQALAESAYTTKFEYGTPEDTLNFIKDHMSDKFSPIAEPNLDIKYVHPSLEEHLSPAFYLIPPIDDPTKEVIYINKSQKYDLSTQLYPTIAHEGFPGHLYQTAYFRSLKVPYIRQNLSFDGYVEGWATYAENLSLSLTEKDPNLVKMLQLDKDLNMLFVARVDIGINYEGWDREKTSKYFKDLGLEIDITPIFNSVVEEPATILKYTVGYLEILELKDRAQKELGDKFSEKAFHDFFLTTGPSPFAIVNKEMDKWLKTIK